MGGLKKQQSIKINFDTLPDKKKSDENHSFSLSSNNIVQPSDYIRPYDRIEYDQMVLVRTTVWYYKTRPFGLTALTYNV